MDVAATSSQPPYPSPINLLEPFQMVQVTHGWMERDLVGVTRQLPATDPQQ
jgi:hypothetical protein